MDRLISLNAVLSAIGEWIAHREYDYTNATEYLRNRIKAIQSAEPTGWIPVSEPPKKSGRYLAYIINSHDDKLRYIMICDYSPGGYWNWFPDDECASDNVIAWMPLPKPYEPQESEEEK